MCGKERKRPQAAAWGLSGAIQRAASRPSVSRLRASLSRTPETGPSAGDRWLWRSAGAGRGRSAPRRPDSARAGSQEPSPASPETALLPRFRKAGAGRTDSAAPTLSAAPSGTGRPKSRPHRLPRAANGSAAAGWGSEMQTPSLNTRQITKPLLRTSDALLRLDEVSDTLLIHHDMSKLMATPPAARAAQARTP